MAFGTDDNQEPKPAEGDQTTAPNGDSSTNELPAEIQKKLDHQDQFIETLKKEAQVRDERLIELLEKQAQSTDAAMSRAEITTMIESLKAPVETPTQETSPGKEISIDEVVGAVGDKLKEEALKQKRATNLANSMAAAKAAIGDDYDKVVVEQAYKRGMTVDSLNEMAENNPQVFAELFIPKKEEEVKPDTSNSNLGTGFNPERAPERRAISKMNTKERGAYIKQLIDSQT